MRARLRPAGQAARTASQGSERQEGLQQPSKRQRQEQDKRKVLVLSVGLGDYGDVRKRGDTDHF